MDSITTPQSWCVERESLEIAREVTSGGTGETEAESRAKAWIDEQLCREWGDDWLDRQMAALRSLLVDGDPEPAILLGHEIRELVDRLAESAEDAPWERSPDRNAEILRSRRERPREWRPIAVASVHTRRELPVALTVGRRAGPRARGAGRPRARATARATGDSGDSGSGSEPPGKRPGETAGPPHLLLVHCRLGRVNSALARHLRRIGA